MCYINSGLIPLRRYGDIGKALINNGYTLYIIYNICICRVCVDYSSVLPSARRFFTEDFMDRFKATLMDEAAVTRALKRISHEILEKNDGGADLCIIGIKRRGVALANIIADNIYRIEGVRPPTGEIDITFYRDDLTAISADPVIHSAALTVSIVGKKVVLVDDVLYTGRTVRAAMDAIMRFGRAASIQLAVLIDRGHRELPIRGDYVGKNVPTSKSEIIAVKIPPYDDETVAELYEI